MRSQLPVGGDTRRHHKAEPATSAEVAGSPWLCRSAGGPKGGNQWTAVEEHEADAPLTTEDLAAGVSGKNRPEFQEVTVSKRPWGVAR